MGLLRAVILKQIKNGSRKHSSCGEDKMKSKTFKNVLDELSPYGCILGILGAFGAGLFLLGALTSNIRASIRVSTLESEARLNDKIMLDFLAAEKIGRGVKS